MTNIGLLFTAAALVLGGVAVIRSKGDDLAGWGVLVLGVVAVFFR